MTRYDLTAKQRRAVEKAAPERREALTAAFQLQNDAVRIFALKMAVGEYEALEDFIGRV